MDGRTLLVNGVYWSPVGHAVEALQHAYRYHRADPGRRVSVVLNRHTATELTSLCPWLDDAYDVDLPEGDSRVSRRLWRHIPREWDYVVADPRSDPSHHHAVPDAYLDYHRGSAKWLKARVARETWDDRKIAYDVAAYLRLAITPVPLDAPRPRIAILPAGSGRQEWYPSRTSWETILDALAEELGASFVVTGRTAQDGRTVTQFSSEDLKALITRHPGSVRCIDQPFLDQIAVIAACDLLVSPHTGFGFAALAAGTPWLTISGGRWSEYFMSGVPFHSVMPDPKRFPWQAERHMVPVDDGEDGPRVPSMVRERIAEDLPEIVAGAAALVRGDWRFEECEQRHWTKIAELERALMAT